MCHYWRQAVYSWESRTFSTNDYHETTFLTRIFLAFLLTCALQYCHEKVHYRASRAHPRSNSVECEKLCARKERTKGTRLVRKRDAGTTLCRVLLRNVDAPWDIYILFQGERVSAAAVRYYFRCGSLLVCRWASATTFGAAVSTSDWWLSTTTFGAAISASDR